MEPVEVTPRCLGPARVCIGVRCSMFGVGRSMFADRFYFSNSVICTASFGPIPASSCLK